MGFPCGQASSHRMTAVLTYSPGQLLLGSSISHSDRILTSVVSEAKIQNLVRAEITRNRVAVHEAKDFHRCIFCLRWPPQPPQLALQNGDSDRSAADGGQGLCLTQQGLSASYCKVNPLALKWIMVRLIRRIAATLRV